MLVYLNKYFFYKNRQSEKDETTHRISIHAKIYMFANSFSKYLFIELSENAERIHLFCVHDITKGQEARKLMNLS